MVNLGMKHDVYLSITDLQKYIYIIYNILYNIIYIYIYSAFIWIHMCIFCICQKIVPRFESFPPSAPVPEKVHVQRRGPHFTQKTHEHRGHIDEIPTVASFLFQEPAPEPPLKFRGIGSRAYGKTFDMRRFKLTRWGSFVRRPSLQFNSQWHWQWRFGAGS